MTKIIIETQQRDYPGAWDNWALPQFYTVACILAADGLSYTWETVPDGTKPNATPEQVAAYEWIRFGEDRDRERQEEERRFNTPTKGKQVRVFKGRKVPIGTEGRVFWYGENQWGYSCGLELQDGTRVFTAAGNVQVIGLAG